MGQDRGSLGLKSVFDDREADAASARFGRVGTARRRLRFGGLGRAATGRTGRDLGGSDDGVLFAELAGGAGRPAAGAGEAARAAAAGREERGAVFTRAEVVAFVLDLVGYTDERPLAGRRLLEPSTGDGDSLVPAVGRLLRAWRRDEASVAELAAAVRAVEVHRPTFERAAGRVRLLLEDAGLTSADAARVAGEWLVCDDFLLAGGDGLSGAVVGDPPHVRHERVPKPLMEEYLRR